MAQVKFVRGNKITKGTSWNSKVTTDSIAFDKDNKEIYLGSDKYSQTKLTELTNDNAALLVGDSLNVAFSKLNNIIIDNEEVTAEALNDLNNHKVNTEDLATVATTGSYNDLTDKPNIPVGPMVFKGSLGTGGTITALPTASSDNTGYTYKVITDGTYASQSAKAGDTFVSDGSAWILIPSGDEPAGTVTSVGMTVPTGLSVTPNSSNPITSSGTFTISYANGYSIPTTAKQTSWDNKISAVKTLKTNNTTAQTASASETLSGSGTINLHKVSKTGSYNDLLNKPTIPTVGTLKSDNTTAQTPSASESFSNTINVHKIAKTGDYNDLLNKPTISTPTIVEAQMTNGALNLTNYNESLSITITSDITFELMFNKAVSGENVILKVKLTSFNDSAYLYIPLAAALDASPEDTDASDTLLGECWAFGYVLVYVSSGTAFLIIRQYANVNGSASEDFSVQNLGADDVTTDTLTSKEETITVNGNLDLIDTDSLILGDLTLTSILGNKVEAFRVNFVSDGTQINSCDKTFAQITAACNAGKIVYGVLNNGYGIGWLTQISSTSLAFNLVDTDTRKITSYELTVRNDDTYQAIRTDIVNPMFISAEMTNGNADMNSSGYQDITITNGQPFSSIYESVVEGFGTVLRIRLTQNPAYYIYIDLDRAFDAPYGDVDFKTHVSGVSRMLNVDIQATITENSAYIQVIRYANIDSPAFTGTPTAPTAASGTNTTQIATTAFVQQELTNFNDDQYYILDSEDVGYFIFGIDGLEERQVTINTLANDIIQGINDEKKFFIITDDAAIVPISVTHGPDASTYGNNLDRIVISSVYNGDLLNLGLVSSDGTNWDSFTPESKLVDNYKLRQAFSNSPTLGGSPQSTTPLSGDNSTRIATTEWVQLELADFDDEIFVPVSTLPTTDIKTNKIYIVPNSLASPENNLYDEYIYKNNAWELIGTSLIDLNGKLDKLISGTNIKTVNDKSLLGSGDVPIIIEGTYYNSVFTSYTYDANTGYAYQIPAAYTGDTRILYVDTISNVIYRYDGSLYVKLYNFNTDSTPTSGSSNFVTSGGVYNALYKSGTTAQRPTTNLVIGMQYFDTTLGQPIWWNGTAWVDALGNTPGSRNYVYVENN